MPFSPMPKSHSSPTPILQRFSLEGKTALVTGAAGLYGQAILDGLAEAGARVHIASRDLKKLEEVAAARRARGHDVKAFRFDQSSLKSIEKLGRDVAKEGLDVLVNNAATRPMKSYNDPVKNFAASMQTNATGLFALTRAMGEIMENQKSGSIINIGSIQGMIGPDAWLYEGLPFNGFIPDYFFHKGGMLNFTRYLAAQYGPAGIRCNLLSPGGVTSDRVPPKFMKRYSARTFLGRMAALEDIQGAVVFLASDASRYITGTNLPVDGGYTAK